MDNIIINLSAYPGYTYPKVLTVQEQIASLSYQYMRMMLILSAITFIYVIYNYLFRFDNEYRERIGYAFDAGMIVVSSFLLVVSVIYFTGWY